jgi:hypothetical protein
VRLVALLADEPLARAAHHRGERAPGPDGCIAELDDAVVSAPELDRLQALDGRRLRAEEADVAQVAGVEVCRALQRVIGAAGFVPGGRAVLEAAGGPLSAKVGST